MRGWWRARTALHRADIHRGALDYQVPPVLETSALWRRIREGLLVFTLRGHDLWQLGNDMGLSRDDGMDLCVVIGGRSKPRKSARLFPGRSNDQREGCARQMAALAPPDARSALAGVCS